MYNVQAYKILIVDEMHEVLMQTLADNSIEYSYQPDINEEQVLQIIHEYQGLVIRSKFNVGHNILPHVVSLKMIVRAGSGMDNLDVELLEANDICCYNCPEGNRDGVAEQTIGTLLSISSKIVKGHEETGQLIWDREGNRGFEIMGKTVGIIGYGNTGSMVAKKLSGFDCQVIAYDKYKSGFSNPYVEEVELKELYRQSDIISFHIPLTDETRGWIGNRFFDSLSKPIVLLNLSRGGIMDTAAIVDALREGQIIGLGLDVLENENINSWKPEDKTNFSELRSFEQVVITPHVGGWTAESYRRLAKIAASKIIGHFEKSIPFVKDEDNISDNT
jgi:D-3-phosphoglycerate dehydrogenase / 2-oxoglutarate reductase